MRRAAVINLVGQVVIVFTGGLVRLTGSGLGCPTWPQCVPGSYTPVAHQPQGWHKDVEWVNRQLTYVLGAIALAVLVLVVLQLRATGTRSRLLTWLAAAPLLGVFAQAILGGITVLTHLAPAPVAMHFLLSMVLVSAAMALVLMLRPPAPGPVPRQREIRWLCAALSVSGAVVLTLGTVVTGSGPHSGDAGHPSRFGFDPRTVSWLHADAVWLFTGLALALFVALRLVDAPEAARRGVLHLLGAIALQGVIGYVQYATGLPIGLVAVHLVGAAAIAAGVTAAVIETLRARPVATGGTVPDPGAPALAPA